MVGMAIAAVVTAKGAKWKLINLGVIVGLIFVGLLTGLVAGMWARNNALGVDIALPLAIMLGFVGGLGCYRRNNWREKRATAASQTGDGH